MNRAKVFIYIILLSTVVLLLSSTASCSQLYESQIEINSETLQKFNTEGTGHLEIYEGLHITGNPIDVDIETYRLKITGAVEEELSITFDELKKMESVREEIELVCPTLFVDKGYWTGVRVIDLLNLAGIKEEATSVEFISIDGNYTVPLPVEKARGDGVLIAYQFNGKEFSKYHGYPLRLVVKDKAGSFWVKWLGEIRISTDIEKIM